MHPLSFSVFAIAGVFALPELQARGQPGSHTQREVTCGDFIYFSISEAAAIAAREYLATTDSKKEFEVCDSARVWAHEGIRLVCVYGRQQAWIFKLGRCGYCLGYRGCP